MRILRNMAEPLAGLLKDQRIREGESYRLMHFVVQQPVEEGLLLYHVVTKAIVLLSPEEAAGMQKKPRLRSRTSLQMVCRSSIPR